MRQAWRRPIVRKDITKVMKLYATDRKRGADFMTALKTATIAVLCSPEFIFINRNSSRKKRQISEHELATRLSLFLWNSLPDEALQRQAQAGTLRDSLDSQIDRLLADARSSSLVTVFAREWLRADDFDRFAPDRGIYKDVYSAENGTLLNDMDREPLETFSEILKHDLPLADMLKSDWIMANQTLARYYGITEVSGSHFRRITVPPNSHRGGLLTMAAFHKWGSDGNRTKPVDRGKYILGVLFNDPPNPPPANAGEVEPNIGNNRLTVRERLEKHRSIESCAACHQRIDPYGLGMENYNAVGKWRNKMDGERHWGTAEMSDIDASGTLPNGHKFADSEGFRTAIFEQRGRFHRGFAEKFLAYALGRTIDIEDRPTIDHLTQVLDEQRTLSALIKEIVKHDEFHMK
jgi:hypothetical protein